MLKLDIQTFSGVMIYDFIVNKTIVNNQVTVKLTPDTSDVIDLGVDVDGNPVYIDDSCTFELEGWTKVNDGEGSLSKVYTSNTTENVSVEYTTINANTVTFEAIVTVTEIETANNPVALSSNTYSPINWKSGTVTKQAYVTIDGVEYPVTPATVTGGTPINVTNLKNMEDGIINLFNMIYPVGSIYMSISEINPSQLFGFGTWEQIKDTFLLSAGDTYSAGSTGGGQAHNNMPPYLAVYMWKRVS